MRATAAADRQASVFVSILPQKYIVERVGGAHVSVNVMVKPGHSPATYEPSFRQMRALSRADIYFQIGVPFETAWTQRIQDGHARVRIVDTSKGIPLRRMETHAHAHADGEDPSAHQEQKDFHVWTSPPIIKIIASNIRDALTAVLPARQEAFKKNTAAFHEELDQLETEIKLLLAGARQRTFMVFHPAWGYYADTFGLKQLPIEIEGKSPGMKSLSALIDKGKEENVGVIFVQKQFSSTEALAIAKEIGADVVAVDPLAENVIENLRHVTREFLKVFQ